MGDIIMVPDLGHILCPRCDATVPVRKGDSVTLNYPVVGGETSSPSEARAVDIVVNDVIEHRCAR